MTSVLKTVPAARRGPMTPVMYRVTDRVQEVASTATLTLHPIGEAIDAPLPGQFTMLWAFGIGEAPISLARIGTDGALVHTIRAVGAVTNALCALEVGDEVGVRGPFGSSWPIAGSEGDDVMVVAGGLGLSPVRPIIDQVLADRDRFRACTLFVGARDPRALIYKAELEALADDPRLTVEIIVDTADSEWTGEVGLITTLIANATIDASRTHVFLCGPEPMMRYGAMGAQDQGVVPEQIWLSLERNMHCAVVHCGHCQLGPLFLCKDGPIVSWPTVDALLRIADR